MPEKSLPRLLQTLWKYQQLSKQSTRQKPVVILIYHLLSIQIVAASIFQMRGVKPLKRCSKAIHSGYPYDNACIESFHSLIKREWLNRFHIINYKHAYRLVFEYIETFYNTVRIHSHCDYMSPNDFEKLFERVSSLPAA